MDDREDLNSGSLANGLVRNALSLCVLFSWFSIVVDYVYSMVAIGFFWSHTNTWKDQIKGK